MSGFAPSFGGAYRVHRRVDLSRPSDRRGAVAIALAGLLALLIWSPSIGGRAPGDPAGVAGDARLARCGATVPDVEFAFTIPRASDYQQYLPAMGDFSELDLDEPALVVVFRADTSGAAASTSPDTGRKVCIYVGKAGQGELDLYSDVSIEGLRATPDGPVLVPPPNS
jgi:hypothetical protein